MELPKRRFALSLELGADTFEELVNALENFAYHTAVNLPTVATDNPHGWNGASGGPASGYSYALRIDESIDHDKYMEAIEAWKATRDAAT